MKPKQITAIILSAILSLSVCLPLSGISALAAEDEIIKDSLEEGIGDSSLNEEEVNSQSQDAAAVELDEDDDDAAAQDEADSAAAHAEDPSSLDEEEYTAQSQDAAAVESDEEDDDDAAQDEADSAAAHAEDPSSLDEEEDTAQSLDAAAVELDEEDGETAQDEADSATATAEDKNPADPASASDNSSEDGSGVITETPSGVEEAAGAEQLIETPGMNAAPEEEWHEIEITPGADVTLKVEEKNPDGLDLTYHWFDNFEYDDEISGNKNELFIWLPRSSTTYRCEVRNAANETIRIVYFDLFINTHMYARDKDDGVWYTATDKGDYGLVEHRIERYVPYGECARLEVEGKIDSPMDVWYDWEYNGEDDNYYLEELKNPYLISKPVYKPTEYICAVRDYWYNKVVFLYTLKPALPETYRAWLEGNESEKNEAVQTELIYPVKRVVVGDTYPLKVCTEVFDESTSLSFQWYQYDEDKDKFNPIKGATSPELDAVIYRGDANTFQCIVSDQNNNKVSITCEVTSEIYYLEDGEARITDTNTNYVYTGRAIKPNVAVTLDDVTLTKGKDYRVDYYNNLNAGRATISIKGLGSYDGELTLKYEINKAAQSITGVSGTYNKTFGNSSFNLNVKANKTPALTYTSSDTEVVAVDKNGQVSIKGAGKATITINAAATKNYLSARKKVTVKVAKASNPITIKEKIVDGYIYKVFNDDPFSLGAASKGGRLTYTSLNKQVVTVSTSGKVLIKNSGETTIKITARETDNYKAGLRYINIVVAKATPKIKVTTTSRKFKTLSCVKADQKFNLGAGSPDSLGAISYSKKTGSSLISVDKRGNITLKKGPRLGKYTADIVVTIAEKGNYKKASKIFKVTITVTP